MRFTAAALRATIAVALFASAGVSAAGASAAASAVDTPVTGKSVATDLTSGAFALSFPWPAVTTVRQPPVHDMLIPFGSKRKHEMSLYSKRHYGKAGWRLRHPKVIVEHYADIGSIRGIFNTFAPDRPDVELGELPNVCSHFAISPSGRIYRFVPLSIRCRHTVGLNDVAIGVEHVGFSDSDVLDNPELLAASLRLTRWLRCKYDIPIKDVIGHNESLSSPFHHERVRYLKKQTHGDMRLASMRKYRRQLHAEGPCRLAR